MSQVSHVLGTGKKRVHSVIMQLQLHKCCLIAKMDDLKCSEAWCPESDPVNLVYFAICLSCLLCLLYLYISLNRLFYICDSLCCLSYECLSCVFLCVYCSFQVSYFCMPVWIMYDCHNCNIYIMLYNYMFIELVSFIYIYHV